MKSGIGSGLLCRGGGLLSALKDYVWITVEAVLLFYGIM